MKKDIEPSKYIWILRDRKKTFDRKKSVFNKTSNFNQTSCNPNLFEKPLACNFK